MDLAAAEAVLVEAVHLEDGRIMKTLAQQFLTPEEQQRITQCVHGAEKLTSGEIVPMVSSESHTYPLSPIIGGTFFALPGALLAARIVGKSLWIGPDNMWLFLVSFIVIFIPAFQLIKRLSWLKRLFLLPKRADEEVRDAALTAFYTEKLYKTKDENGILLYISVFERRVWILADSGINEKISHDHWSELVGVVTDGIKANRQCDAICEAITRIGEILSDAFPIKQDDTDELHNLIIR